MGQYNRIAEAIKGLHAFSERVKLMELEPERKENRILKREIFLCKNSM